jgi:hypothetical protein
LLTFHQDFTNFCLDRNIRQREKSLARRTKIHSPLGRDGHTLGH